ncbi:hypothetical protein [Nocardia sp. NPDC050406]|uniref:hypothetical protein n=1 Tax=Nocardia sp. NPDC050406 TaxID=3364318 RepID=UPI0037922D15
MIAELYRQAAELDWELLPATEKKLRYRRWAADPAIGGRLREYLGEQRIPTWIKDTPMKEYARAQEGFGSMARFAVRRFRPPDYLIETALGPEWRIRPGSVGEKPMHCFACSAEEERYVCWGRPSTFRDLVWAALKAAVEMPTRPMIIVTLQEGIVLPPEDQKTQSAIAEHCRMDLRYVGRQLYIPDDDVSEHLF